MPYRPNPEFGKEMREGPLRAALQADAELIKAQAEALTPRSSEQHRHAADSFEVEQEAGEIVVTNSAFWFTWMEFGSVNNPPHAPLRRAVQAAGFELHEAPKP